MSEQEMTDCENRPTIFGPIPEKNVTFCVDTSGSMYVGLEAVKEDLIEALLKKAYSQPETMFNLIEFNSEVTQWADKMVRCTPETVNVAKTWIKNLSSKTGTNTQDALLTALSDPGCEAVYLVTDGLPDQYPEDILDHVGYAGQGRPMHCIYLLTTEPDSAATDFLEDLASETYGSFHEVSLTSRGCVERITPVLGVDHSRSRVIRTVNGTVHPPSKACSVTTTLQYDPENSFTLAPRVWLANNPYLSPYNYPNWWASHIHARPWSRYRPARGWLKAQEEMLDQFDNFGLSPSAGALLIGKRVLARNIEDGYFYLATVQSQILEDKFLIGFGPSQHGRFKDTVYQETWVYDIISYEDAKRHAIISGDKVLATWLPEGEKFCPGTVIKGHEKRQSEVPNEDEKITVLFSNRKTETVPLDTAVWIPMAVFERLDLELRMPSDARHSLEERKNYPIKSLPGYPTSGPVGKPQTFRPAPPFELGFDSLAVEQALYGHPDYYPLHPVLFKKKEKQLTSSVKSEDLNSTIPGTNMTQDELQKKVTSQLEEHLADTEAVQSHERDVVAERRARLEELKLKRSCWERELNKRNKNAEIERLGEEILEREREIKRLTTDSTEEKDNQVIKDEEGAAGKRQFLLEEIRKREKELEILLREEEASREEARIVTEREGRYERQREKALREQELDKRPRSIYREETEVEREARILEREAELERRERELTRQIERERLLGRSKLRENNLRKSVSFKDMEDYKDRGYDSGHGSSPEFWGSEEYQGPMAPVYRSVYHRRHSAKRRKSNQRPEWKHWGNQPPTEIGVKTTAASKGLKPFRETMLQAAVQPKDRTDRRPQTAFEPRDHNIRFEQRQKYPVEWTSPNFRYVDTFAKHNYNNSVGQLLKPVPQPPSQPRPQSTTFPDSEVGVIMGVRERVGPTKEEAKLQNRRAHVMARQSNYNNKLQEHYQMRESMDAQNRQRVVDRIQHDRDRQTENLRTIQRTMNAKQMINQELRSRLAENTHSIYDREQRRIDARRTKREQREVLRSEQVLEVQEKQIRQQSVKVMKSQLRWNEVNNRLNEEERNVALKDQQSRMAKINRIQHFNNLETVAQQSKELHMSVTSQHLALYRSQVLP